MRLLPYGDRGLLVEVDDTAAVVALAGAIRTDPDLEDLRDLLADVVPGARTVLLVARPSVALDQLVARSPTEFVLERALEQHIRLGNREPAAEVVIPVMYDGPDLARVATITGLDEAEVVAAHTGTPWRVAFGGFAPGFAYLVGGDARLQVARRDSPRTTVPAGSVGLAGEFSGIYPRPSPGGWQLIGHTDAVLWDLDRDPPALLGAGTVVRFEAQ